MKKTYENLTDKQVIIDYCKEVKRDGEFNAMIVNMTLLSIAMDELNDANKMFLTHMRVIEHWWDGIGKWKAQMINSEYLNKTYYEVITHPNTNTKPQQPKHILPPFNPSNESESQGKSDPEIPEYKTSKVGKKH